MPCPRVRRGYETLYEYTACVTSQRVRSRPPPALREGCAAVLGNGGAGDTEQLGELGGGVAAGSVQLRDGCLLARLELGLLTAEPALGLRGRHALASPHPDQVGLKLSDHGQR
jgi:hypothetical protein